MSYHSATALLDRGPAKPTLYTVSLGSKVMSRTNSFIDLFCSSATIPAKRVNTVVSLGHETIGVYKEHPTAITYGKPLTLNFIEPRDFSVYADIERWMTGIAPTSNTAGVNRHMQYRSDYADTIVVRKLEPGNDARVLVDPDFISNDDWRTGYQVTHKWTFHEAYPISIGQVALSSEMTDSLVQYGCEFTYSTYESDGILDDIELPVWLKEGLRNSQLAFV